MLKDRLARKLRKERLRRRWTLGDAAAALGVSPEQYERLEAGRTNATLLTLERLCQVLRVDVRFLFEL